LDKGGGFPLLIVIMVAIATTKVTELFRINQGVWCMVSDARTDFAMLCSLIFLILVDEPATQAAVVPLALFPLFFVQGVSSRMPPPVHARWTNMDRPPA
jgi:hypothetical protein